jgi:hypothetical protein
MRWQARTGHNGEQSSATGVRAKSMFRLLQTSARGGTTTAHGQRDKSNRAS